MQVDIESKRAAAHAIRGLADSLVTAGMEYRDKHMHYEGHQGNHAKVAAAAKTALDVLHPQLASEADRLAKLKGRSAPVQQQNKTDAARARGVGARAAAAKGTVGSSSSARGNG